MPEGRSIGIIYCELDLDPSRYTRSQQRILQQATTTAKELEGNFQVLGIKSDAMFDLMRKRAEVAFQGIAVSSKATSADMIRAREALANQWKKIDEEQYGRQTSLIDSLRSSIGMLLPGIGGMVVGLGGIAGALAGAAYAAKESLGTFKDLAFQVRDLAFLSGGTAEQVSGLIDYLDDFGVQTETVDRAMVFLSRAVREGSPALDALNISIRYGNGQLKTAHDLFYEVIDALRNTKSETERNALAQELFSRGWIAMVPIIEKGAAALREAASASQLLMTKEDIDRADNYRASLAQLGDAWELLKLKLARGIIGPITFVIKWMTSEGKEYKTKEDLIREQMWEGTFPTFEEPSGPVSGDYMDVGARFGPQKPRGPIPAETPGEAKKRLALEKERKERYEEGVRIARELASEELKEFARVEAAKKKQTEQDEADAKAREAVIEEEYKVQREAQEAFWKYDKIISDERLKELEAMYAEEKKIGDKFLADQNKTISENYKKQLEDQKKKREEMEADAEEARDAAFEEELRQIEERRSGFRGVFDSIADGISTAVKGVQQGTQTMEEAFHNMAVNIMLSIQDYVIRQGINAMGDALLGAKGTSEKGLLGPVLGGIGGIISGLFGGGGAVPGSAFFAWEGQKGGIVPGPVGKPISALLHGGEKVLTPEQQREQAGTQITQVFAPQVGVPEAVRRELWAMMPAIKDQAVQAVLEARNRGGAMARAMGARR